MLDYHQHPQLDSCDVCRYAVERGFDCGYEHALTRLATVFLLEDLGELAGGTTRLSALAVQSTGVEPGPLHRLEARHWFWAMFYEPDIRISLREPQR